MKRSMKIGFCAMRLCVMVLGIFLILPNVSAENDVPDVQAFLPLFERNSLGRKVLDVRFSVITEVDYGDKAMSVKVDIHVVFDAETEKYRAEVTYYHNKPPNDADASDFHVTMWDGKEFVEWKRQVIKDEPGFRALGLGIYEDPGEAIISGRPETPPFVSYCYCTHYADRYCVPFSKTIPEQNPKLVSTAGDTITIEAAIGHALRTFTFSKKTGALKTFVYATPNRENEMIARETSDYFDHVECSGVWIPLRSTHISREHDGRVFAKTEVSVDPKTLRLLDKVEDASIFSKALPAGCIVNDQISNDTNRR